MRDSKIDSPSEIPAVRIVERLIRPGLKRQRHKYKELCRSKEDICKEEEKSDRTRMIAGWTDGKSDSLSVRDSRSANSTATDSKQCKETETKMLRNI